MTNEELIVFARQGNQDAFNKLFINNKKLAHSVAEKFRFSCIEYDDLMSLCYLGMLKAYNNFDVSKSKYASCATSYMRNEILRNLKYNNRYKRKANICSLDKYLESEEGYEIDRTLGDVILESTCDPADLFVKKEENLELLKAIKGLLKRDREIIVLRFYENQSIQEIATVYGCTYQNIDRIIKKSLIKLKNSIKEQ